MIIEQPVEEDVEVEIWGNPWHGIVSGGELVTTVGGVTLSWVQPDYGDCFLFKVPGLPEVTRTEEQLTTDAGKGHEWRNYALLTGWFDRQLYGKVLNPAAGSRNDLKYYYAAGVGDVWQVSLSGITVSGDGASGNVVLRKSVFGSIEVMNLPVSTSWVDTNGTSQHFTVHEVTPDGSKAIIAVFRQKYTHRADYIWYKQSGTRISHGMAYSGNSSGVLDGSFIAGPDALLLLEITKVGEVYSATLSVLKGPEEMYPVPYDTTLETPLDQIVVQAYKTITPGSDDDIDFEVGIFMQGTAPPDYIEWDSDHYQDSILSGEFEVIIGAFFDETNTVKYITVSGTHTRTRTHTITGLPYGPEVIDGGIEAYFIANSTNRYRVLIEVVGSAEVLLKADGVVLSTITAEQELTKDANLGVTTISDMGSVDCDGTIVGSGTIAEEGNSIIASGPSFGDNIVNVSAGPVTINLNLTRFCSGGYGYIMQRYVYSIEAGTGVFIDEINDWYVHKVHSLTKGTSSSIVGTVGGSTANVQQIYNDTKISHHPVTGSFLVNAGAWV